jgi:hypothetical protein
MNELAAGDVTDTVGRVSTTSTGWLLAAWRELKLAVAATPTFAFTTSVTRFRPAAFSLCRNEVSDHSCQAGA